MQSWIMNNLLKGSIQLRLKPHWEPKWECFLTKTLKKKQSHPPHYLNESIIKSWSFPPGQVSAHWSWITYLFTTNEQWIWGRKRGKQGKKNKVSLRHGACYSCQLFDHPPRACRRRRVRHVEMRRGATPCCSSRHTPGDEAEAERAAIPTGSPQPEEVNSWEASWCCLTLRFKYWEIPEIARTHSTLNSRGLLESNEEVWSERGSF